MRRWTATDASFAYATAIFVAETLAQAHGVTPGTFPIPTGTLSLALDRPLVSMEFWAASRSVGLPLLIKLLGGSIRGLVVFQIALYVCAWGFLAWEARRSSASGLAQMLAPLAVWTSSPFSQASPCGTTS